MAERSIFMLFSLMVMSAFAQTDSLAIRKLAPSVDATAAIWSSPFEKWHRLPSSSAAIEFSAHIEIGSNAIRNDLFKGILRGEFLSRDLRMKSSEAIDNTATAGQVLDFRLRYSLSDSLFGKPHLSSTLQIGHVNAIGTRFQKELFDLTFFGNKPFVNETIDLAPTKGEQLKYQKFGWGITNTKKRFIATVNIIKGQELQFVDIEKASVFTATDGRQIDVVLQGQYLLSDTANDSFSALNGIGIGIDLEKQFGLKDNYSLNVSVQDLGVIGWNQNSLSISADSSYNYRGIGIDNIFDLDDILIGDDALYDTIGLDFDKRPVIRLAPVLLSAELVKLKLRWRHSVRVDYRYLVGYTPKFSVASARKFNRSLIGLNATYGGFSNLRFGLRFGQLFWSNTIVLFEVPNLPGPFSDAGNGMELGFRLSQYF